MSESTNLQTENAENLGIKDPILPAKPLGQTTLTPQFIVPLGTQSISILDQNIFSPKLENNDVLGGDFQDSPFFSDYQVQKNVDNSLPQTITNNPNNFSANIVIPNAEKGNTEFVKVQSDENQYPSSKIINPKFNSDNNSELLKESIISNTDNSINDIKANAIISSAETTNTSQQSRYVNDFHQENQDIGEKINLNSHLQASSKSQDLLNDDYTSSIPKDVLTSDTDLNIQLLSDNSITPDNYVLSDKSDNSLSAINYPEITPSNQVYHAQYHNSNLVNKSEANFVDKDNIIDTSEKDKLQINSPEILSTEQSNIVENNDNISHNLSSNIQKQSLDLDNQHTNHKLLVEPSNTIIDNLSSSESENYRYFTSTDKPGIKSSISVSPITSNSIQENSSSIQTSKISNISQAVESPENIINQSSLTYNNEALGEIHHHINIQTKQESLLLTDTNHHQGYVQSSDIPSEKLNSKISLEDSGNHQLSPLTQETENHPTLSLDTTHPLIVQSKPLNHQEANINQEVNSPDNIQKQVSLNNQENNLLPLEKFHSPNSDISEVFGEISNVNAENFNSVTDTKNYSPISDTVQSIHSIDNLETKFVNKKENNIPNIDITARLSSEKEINAKQENPNLTSNVSESIGEYWEEQGIISSNSIESLNEINSSIPSLNHETFNSSNTDENDFYQTSSLKSTIARKELDFVTENFSSELTSDITIENNNISKNNLSNSITDSKEKTLINREESITPIRLSIQRDENEDANNSISQLSNQINPISQTNFLDSIQQYSEIKLPESTEDISSKHELSNLLPDLQAKFTQTPQISSSDNFHIDESFSETLDLKEDEENIFKNIQIHANNFSSSQTEINSEKASTPETSTIIQQQSENHNLSTPTPELLQVVKTDNLASQFQQENISSAERGADESLQMKSVNENVFPSTPLNESILPLSQNLNVDSTNSFLSEENYSINKEEINEFSSQLDFSNSPETNEHIIQTSLDSTIGIDSQFINHQNTDLTTSRTDSQIKNNVSNDINIFSIDVDLSSDNSLQKQQQIASTYQDDNVAITPHPENTLESNTPIENSQKYSLDSELLKQSQNNLIQPQTETTNISHLNSDTILTDIPAAVPTPLKDDSQENVQTSANDFSSSQTEINSAKVSTPETSTIIQQHSENHNLSTPTSELSQVVNTDNLASQLIAGYERDSQKILQLKSVDENVSPSTPLNESILPLSQNLNVDSTNSFLSEENYSINKEEINEFSSQLDFTNPPETNENIIQTSLDSTIGTYSQFINHQNTDLTTSRVDSQIKNNVSNDISILSVDVDLSSDNSLQKQQQIASTYQNDNVTINQPSENTVESNIQAENIQKYSFESELLKQSQNNLIQPQTETANISHLNSDTIMTDIPAAVPTPLKDDSQGNVQTSANNFSSSQTERNSEKVSTPETPTIIQQHSENHNLSTPTSELSQVVNTDNLASQFQQENIFSVKRGSDESLQMKSVNKSVKITSKSNNDISLKSESNDDITLELNRQDLAAKIDETTLKKIIQTKDNLDNSSLNDITQPSDNTVESNIQAENIQKYSFESELLKQSQNNLIQPQIETANISHLNSDTILTDIPAAVSTPLKDDSQGNLQTSANDFSSSQTEINSEKVSTPETPTIIQQQSENHNLSTPTPELSQVVNTDNLASQLIAGYERDSQKILQLKSVDENVSPSTTLNESILPLSQNLNVDSTNSFLSEEHYSLHREDSNESSSQLDFTNPPETNENIIQTSLDSTIGTDSQFINHQNTDLTTSRVDSQIKNNVSNDISILSVDVDLASQNSLQRQNHKTELQHQEDDAIFSSSLSGVEKNNLDENINSEKSVQNQTLIESEYEFNNSSLGISLSEISPQSNIVNKKNTSQVNQDILSDDENRSFEGENLISRVVDSHNNIITTGDNIKSSDINRNTKNYEILESIPELQLKSLDELRDSPEPQGSIETQENIVASHFGAKTTEKVQLNLDTAISPDVNLHLSRESGNDILSEPNVQNFVDINLIQSQEEREITNHIVSDRETANTYASKSLENDDKLKFISQSGDNIIQPHGEVARNNPDISISPSLAKPNNSEFISQSGDNLIQPQGEVTRNNPDISIHPSLAKPNNSEFISQSGDNLIQPQGEVENINDIIDDELVTDIFVSKPLTSQDTANIQLSPLHESINNQDNKISNEQIDFFVARKVDGEKSQETVQSYSESESSEIQLPTVLENISTFNSLQNSQAWNSSFISKDMTNSVRKTPIESMPKSRSINNSEWSSFNDLVRGQKAPAKRQSQEKTSSHQSELVQLKEDNISIFNNYDIQRMTDDNNIPKQEEQAGDVFEKLAQEMYLQLRQRLKIEKERHGKGY
ncbi:hypothetical protein [Calothrix sp. 336/3]|uniref:hypothetical protein n=1 Tax=Calothrix sp. 336/3 TaxID=1337936 RepID=UPI0004E2E695|nr:hypothetical protein [Calothrix sp. 336/3]AKG20503.1 hypothetical protein IJ00_03505 [Calothrix sp. 336/3]